jgi:hypothetical protein
MTDDVSAGLFASCTNRKAHSFYSCKIEALLIKYRYACSRRFHTLLFQIHEAMDMASEVPYEDCVGS